ncbi:hypothetical protein A5N82_12890 [Christensenella minuta]|nr:hypothetical protein [Christensenella minuta]AYH41295.1 hypothetical protein B1H56_12670 [Christensenella minuta]AYH41330.1 hypothetical protein B1H56_12860 [Christensenella minuta]OAQ39350.1 hypothetical protein A5N82_12890 [Christensenella minuta]
MATEKQLFYEAKREQERKEFFDLAEKCRPLIIKKKYKKLYKIIFENRQEKCKKNKIPFLMRKEINSHQCGAIDMLMAETHRFTDVDIKIYAIVRFLSGATTVDSAQMLYQKYLYTAQSLISYKGLCDLYEIIGNNDDKTCAACKNHIGKSYLVKDAKIGINTPPFCDECRCCIASVVNI